MAQKKKAKKKAKTRKPASKKKTIRKKKAAKKKPAKKKVTKKAVKKITRKKPAKKAAKKKAPGKKPAPKTAVSKKPVEVTPGPPAGTIPPVEEPTQHEEAIGVITHYYSHLSVAVIQLNKETLKTGDTIHVKGHTTDFTQKVESMEYEHRHIDQASAGQSVGIKAVDHAREHDIVYLVK